MKDASLILFYLDKVFAIEISIVILHQNAKNSNDLFLVISSKSMMMDDLLSYRSASYRDPQEFFEK